MPPRPKPEDKLMVKSDWWEMKTKITTRQRDTMLRCAEYCGITMTQFVREAVLEHIKRTKRRIAREAKAVSNVSSG